MEQRRLAGAGGAHDGDVLPGPDAEADLVQGLGHGLGGAVVFVYGLYLEKRGFLKIPAIMSVHF